MNRRVRLRVIPQEPVELITQLTIVPEHYRTQEGFKI